MKWFTSRSSTSNSTSIRSHGSGSSSSKSTSLNSQQHFLNMLAWGHLTAVGPKSHLNKWSLSNCCRPSEGTLTQQIAGALQPKGLPCSPSASTDWVMIILHRNCPDTWAHEEVFPLSNTSTPSVSLIINLLISFISIHLYSRYARCTAY